MGKFQFQAILFLVLLVSSSLSSADHFINCGSSSSITLPDGRKFDPDILNSGSLSVGSSKSKTICNSSALPAGTSPLYQTARVFRHNSSYQLNITDSGSYLVRLHFFAFSAKEFKLSDVFFNVSTSKFLLFSGNISEEVPVVKELFLIGISSGKLGIYFIPAKEKSFSFINAIEVIYLPQDFFSDNRNYAVPKVGTGNDKFFHGLLSNGLSKIYRVNIGGPEINGTESTDPLWRNWVKDDPFILTKLSISFSTTKLNSENGGIPDIAADLVYKSCRHMATNSSNITWSFQVRKKVMHFVRLHFCDIISASFGILKFDLYMGPNFSKVIDAAEYTSSPSSPYFIDLVVNSDDSGYINISIGPNKDNQKKDAYLNGLEIMEFLSNTTLELDDKHIDENSRNHRNLIIGFSVGGVVLISILVLLLLFVIRRKKVYKPAKGFVVKGEVKPRSWITATTESTSSVLPNLNLKLKMPLSEILAATCNFNSELVIGEGGFGKVYKATLSTGTKVAVKRSDSSSSQGRPQFQTEVNVLSSIRHRHLVSLIGYCDEGSEMILAYEFVEKGTLRDHLYSWKDKDRDTDNSMKPESLTWKQRLEICIGAAKGLHYLHTGSDWGIIHGDVKSTNILLDENYVAKVADFGLSKSGPPDPDHDTTSLIGSFGYIDPEYIRTLQLTYKSDVYSFGVVLLEVLCARPPIVSSTRKEERSLAEWGMFWQKKEQLEKIVDPSLVGQINPNSLRKFGEIADKCLKTEGAERPPMLDVCWDLEYALQLQQTAVAREPYDDSTTDVSSNYVFSASSTHIPNKDDCEFPGDDDDIDSKLVFSRSMIHAPR